MINFRFVKSQFKRVWIPLLIFSILALVLLLIALVENQIRPNTFFKHNGTFWDGTTKEGAGLLLHYAYLGVPGFCIMFALSIILNHILISKEVDAGYMASWLTSSMSRRTIINSKLFVLLISILSIPFVMMILQLLVFPFTLKNFNADILARLFLMNFDFMLVVVLFTSINWVVTNFFSKGAYSISIISGFAALFIVMGFLSFFDYLLFQGSLEQETSKFGFAKFFTLTSFFNSAFNFDSKVTTDCSSEITLLICEGDYTEFRELLALEPLDYAWQMPLMAVLTPGFFVLGNELMIKKDLHL